MLLLKAQAAKATAARAWYGDATADAPLPAFPPDYNDDDVDDDDHHAAGGGAATNTAGGADALAAAAAAQAVILRSVYVWG